MRDWCKLRTDLPRHPKIFKAGECHALNAGRELCERKRDNSDVEES